MEFKISTFQGASREQLLKYPSGIIAFQLSSSSQKLKISLNTESIIRISWFYTLLVAIKYASGWAKPNWNIQQCTIYWKVNGRLRWFASERPLSVAPNPSGRRFYECVYEFRENKVNYIRAFRRVLRIRCLLNSSSNLHFLKAMGSDTLKKPYRQR